ncbi:hypothetical protein WN66_05933 [Saccharomyces cerevisiae]|uniref:Putative uncharacterized protein YOR102W n=2 Tax=Saccharomyces cerevisiae TaxID=4932 RepID=YO102_YEAST|nr:RecName: Full=Putative uncharacterized protein YOR102W [Saccharomyces cerevisiae S288C]KZV07989.1 hypothetical protein WN66_05933 [Saccharomyces cerevisiae]CAA99299.1 unnamed protein product [Saccharomyces cerevisiae]CAY86388.1 EC1118_1O4_3092p [Saccharomyces cerevisiae EC1118]
MQARRQTLPQFIKCKQTKCKIKLATINSAKALFLEMPGKLLHNCNRKLINRTNCPTQIMNPAKNALNGKLSRIKIMNVHWITPNNTKKKQNVSISFSLGYFSIWAKYALLEVLKVS